MAVPEAYFEAFFEQLVGTEEATNQFQNELVERVAPHVGGEAVYRELDRAVSAMIQNTVVTASNADWGNLQNTMDMSCWESLGANAQLGVSMTVSALEVVGDAYERYAKQVPQTHASVTANTNRIVRHVYSNAFQDAKTAFKNGDALRAGLNPVSRLHSPLIALSSLRGADSAAIHPRSLRVKADRETGQLDIRLNNQKGKAAVLPLMYGCDTRLEDEQLFLPS